VSEEEQVSPRWNVNLAIFIIHVALLNECRSQRAAPAETLPGSHGDVPFSSTSDRALPQFDFPITMLIGLSKELFTTVLRTC
jgi:hypothetical protein